MYNGLATLATNMKNSLNTAFMERIIFIYFYYNNGSLLRFELV
jgi:hypothetical protein